MLDSWNMLPQEMFLANIILLASMSLEIVRKYIINWEKECNVLMRGSKQKTCVNISSKI